jgi:hypothetical protein
LVHAAAIVAAPILTANLIAAIWRRLDGSLRRRAATAVTAIEGSILIAAIWRRLDGGLRRRRAIAAIKAPVLIAATCGAWTANCGAGPRSRLPRSGF